MEQRTIKVNDSIEDLKVTFYFNILALIVILILFFTLRVRKPPLHKSAKRKQSERKPPATPARLDLGSSLISQERTIFDWIKTFFGISDQDVLICCHKDGFLYLLFIKYLYTYFFMISLGNSCVLIPIFLVNSKISTNLLTAYTINNVIKTIWKLWIVLVFTLLYTVMGFIMLYLFHKRLRSVAVSENKSMVDILCSKRSIMIKGLPKSFVERKKELEIQGFFEELVGENEVVCVKLIPNYKKTYRLLLKKDELLKKLSKVKKRNKKHIIREEIRKGCCCCKIYIDAEDEYRERLRRVREKEKKVRMTRTKEEGSGVGFVVFKSPEYAFLAKRIVFRKFHQAPRYASLELEKWRMYKAPPPNDILWENLGIKSGKKMWSFIIANVSLALFITLMIVPITILNELKTIIYIINARIQEHSISFSWTTTFLDNYLPPLLIYVNGSLIVPFLIYCIANYERKERKSHLEKSILAKSIFFMLFNIIILPSFGLTTIYTLFKQYNW